VATCREGVSAATRLTDPELGGLMRSALGVSCIFTRRFDEALDILPEALALTQASGNKSDEGYVHNNIAVANAGLRRFDDAAESFGRALDLHTNDNGVATALNNIGYAHVLNRDHAAALEYLPQALTLAQGNEDRTASAELADQHAEPVSLGHIGHTHLEAGDLIAAQEKLDMALAMRTRIPDSYEEAHLHRRLSELAGRLGDPTRAAEHRDQAIQLYFKANALPEAEELATGQRPGDSGTTASRSLAAT
jgi:tetratricopeptide (TPR) repeat protein